MKQVSIKLDQVRSPSMKRLLRTLKTIQQDDFNCQGCNKDCKGCMVDVMARESATKFEEQFRQTTLFGAVTA